jgi:hypothetical protein
VLHGFVRLPLGGGHPHHQSSLAGIIEGQLAGRGPQNPTGVDVVLFAVEQVTGESAEA